MKTEYKFNMNDMFDKDNEYDLWVCSITMALQDLLFCINYILRNGKQQADDSKNTSSIYNSFFFHYKILKGILSESNDLLSGFNNSDISENIRNDQEFIRLYDTYMNIYTLVNEDFLHTSRNKTFHYMQPLNPNNKSTLKDNKKMLFHSLSIMENQEESICFDTTNRYYSEFKCAFDTQINMFYYILHKNEDFKYTAEKEKELTQQEGLLVSCTGALTDLFIYVVETFVEDKYRKNCEIKKIITE